MTTVIEHVKHRVVDTGQYPFVHPGLTACGRRFMGMFEPDQNTRHHRPATRRCPVCFP